MKRIEKKLLQYTELRLSVAGCLDGYENEQARVALSYYIRTRLVDTLKGLYGYEATAHKYLGTKITIRTTKYLQWLPNTKHFTVFDLASVCTKVYVFDMQDSSQITGILNFKESYCPEGVYQTYFQTPNRQTYSELVNSNSTDKVRISINSLLVSQTVITEGDVLAVYSLLVSECYESFGKYLEHIPGYTAEFIYPPLSGDYFFSKKNAVFTNVLQLLCYCNVVSKLKGLEPVYTIYYDLGVGCNLNASGYRLPTMYEWRYLSYANEPDFKFPGSNEIREVTVALDNTLKGQIRFDEIEVLGTKMPQGSVAKLKPNGYLLYDMLGLASQLTMDLSITLDRTIFDSMYPEVDEIVRTYDKKHSYDFSNHVAEYFHSCLNRTIESYLKPQAVGEGARYEFSDPSLSECPAGFDSLTTLDGKSYDTRSARVISYRLTNQLGLKKKIENRNLLIKEDNWIYWREYFGPREFHQPQDENLVRLTNGYNFEALSSENIVPAARLVRRC